MATQKPKKKQEYLSESRSTIVTLLLFWCALIVVSSVYLTTPLINEFSSQFQINSVTAAWSSGSFSLFYALGFLFFAPLSDRYGRKEIILFGFFALAIVTWLIGKTDLFWWVVIFRGVQGFVAASFAPTALAYVFDVYLKEKVATAIGFISFGYVTAGIVGQVAADIINQLVGWQLVFIIFGVLYLISFVMVIIILPRSNHEKAPLSLSSYTKKLKAIMKRKSLILCYVITLFLLLTFIGMYTALGEYLSGSPYYLTDKELLFVRAWGLLGMLLSPFANIFVKRFGLLKMFRVSLAVAAIGMFSISLVKGLPFVIIMTVMYVGGISLIFPSIMMIVGQLGGDERAVANAFYAFILFIGASLGPFTALFFMKLGSFTVTFSSLALFLVGCWYVSLHIRV